MNDHHFGYITKLTLNKEPNKQGMCHTVALPIYIKKYLKAKEELWKLKCFTMQKYNLQKIL
jgi:hypothetical protein